MTLLAVLAILAVNFSDRYAPAVADWYTGMVIRYVPEPALRLTPMDDDERAFYACARSVVRRLGGDASIATFTEGAAATTRPLGAGRYLVHSQVDESLEPGVSTRHAFTCTVRVEGTRWVLEDLQLREIESIRTEFATRQP